MVLGMEWLSSLDDIRANLKELSIKIPVDGGYHILKGEPESLHAVTSFKSILKAINDKGHIMVGSCFG